MSIFKRLVATTMPFSFRVAVEQKWEDKGGKSALENFLP